MQRRAETNVISIELYISCRKLANMEIFSKSDPFVKMLKKEQGQWVEVGSTEIIYNDTNPNFTTPLQINYYFEKRQPIRFDVYDYNGQDKSDFIGICETQLASVAGAKDQSFLGDILKLGKKTGIIIIRAEPSGQTNEEYHMSIRGTEILDKRFGFWSTICPFLRFNKTRNGDTQSLLKVYETGPVMNTRYPNWYFNRDKKEYRYNEKLPFMQQRSLKFGIILKIQTQFTQVKDFSPQKKSYISSSYLLSLKTGKVYSLEISILTKYQNLQYKFIAIQVPSFIDYIRGGTQLNLMIAIDFTSSNGDPYDPNSLHYIGQEGRLNQYQTAMRDVLEIIINYDYDQLVPVYGFGCKPQFDHFTIDQKGLVNHCFPLNGNFQNPYVQGINGVLEVYNQAMPSLHFDGPTHFSGILTKASDVASKAQDRGENKYFILLILTDGEIGDKKDSIDLIVRASTLPLSVIIVGLGDDEFTDMKILDDDNNNMIDSKGRKSQRDIVQFVPYNNYKDTPEYLAEQVLQELPDQVVSYMQIQKLKPQNMVRNLEQA